MKLVKLLMIFCLFAFTFFVGIYWGNYMGGEDCVSDLVKGQIEQLEKEKDDLIDSNKELQDQIDDLKKQLKSSSVETEASKSIGTSSTGAKEMEKQILQLLEKENLSFQEIINLYTNSYNKSEWNDLDRTTKAKFQSYYNVSKILRDGDSDAIKGIMDPQHTDIKNLSKDHKWQVLAIGYGTEYKGEYADKNIKSQKGSTMYGKESGINDFLQNRKDAKKTFKSLDSFKNARNYKEC